MEYVGAILGALAFGAPVVENIGKLAQGSRHVIDLADRVIGIFRRRVPQAQQSAAIAAQMTSLVALPPEKQSQFIDRIIENELADKPPEEKAAAKEFVALTIAKIQATFTRPEDPTGQTVPQRFNPLKAVNLAITFPTRLSRFKVGDRPPGAEDYILVEQLAIGGFGEVWKARHEEMQYTFFVFKFCLDPESQQAIFANELETIEIVQSKLKNNPHIVKLISCKLKCDAPWLLYEHIPGGTLLELAASWPAEISARTAIAIEQMKILISIPATPTRKSSTPVQLLQDSARSVTPAASAPRYMWYAPRSWSGRQHRLAARFGKSLGKSYFLSLTIGS